MQQIVEFNSNAPVEVALLYAQGKPVPSHFAGGRVMYSLKEPAAHVMFLDEAVSAKVGALGVAAGERFTICKRGGGKTAKWEVWLSNGAEKVRAAREAGVKVNSDGRPDWGGIPETELEAEMRGKRGSAAAPAASLLERTNALTDIFAAALAHANRHPEVKAEDVRAFLVAAMGGRP